MVVPESLLTVIQCNTSYTLKSKCLATTTQLWGFSSARRYAFYLNNPYRLSKKLDSSFYASTDSRPEEDPM